MGNIQVPIRAWEDDKSASHPELSCIDLAKPRSRQGFHASASTPSVIEDNYIKEYLYAIKDKKSKAREKASEYNQYFLLKQPRKQPNFGGHRTRERYFAFENVDLQGRVISWTEIISVQSVYDVSISEPVFV